MLKKIWRTIFWIYVLMVINFIVIKFDGNINNTINTIKHNAWRRAQGDTFLNLVPSRTFELYFRDLSYDIGLINIMGNIVPFIPLGFLIPMVFPLYRKVLKAMFICLLIILGIESIQYFTYLGIFDIDDVIVNMVSCFIGFLIFIAYKNVLLRETSESKR